MSEYVNHKKGSPLYVTDGTRLCAECGVVKDVQSFERLSNGKLRTVCRSCQRQVDDERAVVKATKALADATAALSRPAIVAHDDAPALRKSLQSTLSHLKRVCGNEFETDGSQVFGRLFAEYLKRIWTEDFDSQGKPQSDFLRLKGFMALQKQMDALLRHDQQKIDLSHLNDDEIRELVTPFMLRWFKENPGQLRQLIDDLPAADEPPVLSVVEGGEDGG